MTVAVAVIPESRAALYTGIPPMMDAPAMTDIAWYTKVAAMRSRTVPMVVTVLFIPVLPVFNRYAEKVCDQRYCRDVYSFL